MKKWILVFIILLSFNWAELFPTSCPLVWFVVKGKIEDRQGHPVSAVRIASFYYEEEYESKGGYATDECLSDKQGFFACKSYFKTAILKEGAIVSCEGQYPSDVQLIFIKEGFLMSRKNISLTKSNTKYSTLDIGSIKLIPIHPQECNN